MMMNDITMEINSWPRIKERNLSMRNFNKCIWDAIREKINKEKKLGQREKGIGSFLLLLST